MGAPIVAGLDSVGGSAAGDVVSLLVTGIGAGALTLPVEKVYGLDEIADAARANSAPGRRGKIRLRP